MDILDNKITFDITDESEDKHHRLSYTGLLPVLLIAVIVLARISYDCYKGQKTRNPQRRRMYPGARDRPSLTPDEPTIYVSPTNLPPPPKYEALAPPSYEEVVGVHYPNYQATQIQAQPITQPIATAMAHSSSSPDYYPTSNVANNVTCSVVNNVANNVVSNVAHNGSDNETPSTAAVITVTEERQTSIRVSNS